MRGSLCIVLLTAVAAAGCSAGGEGEDASLERAELSALVLQPDDLPAAYVRFDHGRQVLADAPGGRRADGARFGRVEGWKARYRRAGAARTTGPLVVESRADLFEKPSGAEDDLEAARADLGDDTSDWQLIGEPGVGDQSFAATVVERSLAGIRHYRVFWRHDNVSATLLVNGFEGKLPLADVLELARKQQRRIEDVAT